MAIDFSIAPFLPPAEPARYARNFLQQVVCELRFPTLFDLNNSVPPPLFVKEFRKEYPYHQHQVNDVSVNDQSFEQVHVHVFRNRRADYTVSLRSSAVTLECTVYTSFEDFKARLSRLIDVASQIIDSDFFTRVGLRYVNAVPMVLQPDVKDNLREFSGWLRSDLVQPILEHDMGILAEYWSRIAGMAEFGRYTMNHGIGVHNRTQAQSYILDFDFSKEAVELSDTLAALDELHKHQFSMFDWSLGPKAREFLGPSTIGTSK